MPTGHAELLFDTATGAATTEAQPATVSALKCEFWIGNAKDAKRVIPTRGREAGAASDDVTPKQSLL
jgi:hypothetical protein